MNGDTLAVLAVALAAGWASGVNVYAAVLVLGLAQRLGFVTLPHDLQVLASLWVLATAALLFVLNFFADKIPLMIEEVVDGADKVIDSQTLSDAVPNAVLYRLKK